MPTDEINIPDNFDSANAFDFRDHLVISASKVIVNFKNTSFMDSAGVGTLVFWLRSIQAAGGEMVFVNLTGQPSDIVKMVGLDKLVEIAEPDQG